jgi:hypothetical protein
MLHCYAWSAKVLGVSDAGSVDLGGNGHAGGIVSTEGEGSWEGNHLGIDMKSSRP